jgi:poly(3-hydroxybutyrate) depolymerase
MRKLAVASPALVTALLLVACSSDAGASQSDTPGPGGTVRKQVATSGGSRDYFLFKPASLPAAGRVPLEVNLVAHGTTPDTGTYNKGASNNGVLLAYAVSPTDWAAAVDDQYIIDLIDDLVRHERADPKRVYLVGGSAGGFKAYKLACSARSSPITGIGIIFGAISTTSAAAKASDVCHPARPISVFAIHGTSDGLVPYNGECHVGRERGNTVCILSQPQTMAFWAKVDGCQPNATSSSGAKHRTDTWGRCASGAGVQLVTVPGGGPPYHCLSVDGIEPTTMMLNFLGSHTPGSGAAPPTPAQPLAASRVLGTTVTRLRAGIVHIRVRLSLSEKVKAKVSLRSGHRTVTSKSARLRKGTASVILALRAGKAKKAYTLRIVLTNDAGNTRVLTRRVVVPKR